MHPVGVSPALLHLHAIHSFGRNLCVGGDADYRLRWEKTFTGPCVRPCAGLHWPDSRDAPRIDRQFAQVPTTHGMSDRQLLSVGFVVDAKTQIEIIIPERCTCANAPTVRVSATRQRGCQPCCTVCTKSWDPPHTEDCCTKHVGCCQAPGCDTTITP